MEENVTLSEGYQDVLSGQEQFMLQAMSYTMYKIGDGINQSYLPILIPIGITGNILSFLVMTQPHNRHMSISYYISALAVSDTGCLITTLTSYLNIVHNIVMIPDQIWHCRFGTFFLWSASLCSTLLIVNMTFDRFYSITRPHKAASFNTVKRAKISIAFILVFSICFNIPYLFTMTKQGGECVPDVSNTLKIFSYWLNYVVQFVIPFVALLAMNSVIIHTIRMRSSAGFKIRGQVANAGHAQGHDQGQGLKSSEKQIFAILLLVAFSFFILVTPLYAFILYSTFVDYTKSSKAFADFYLFYHVMQKMYSTNNAINFFLYVISGNKFRTDLRKMLRCTRCTNISDAKEAPVDLSEPNTKITSIET